MLELKTSIYEVENELVSTGNRADQMEERISDTKDRNLKVMQRKEERLSIKRK